MEILKHPMSQFHSIVLDESTVEYVCEYGIKDRVSIPTAKDQTLTKEEFFKTLSQDEINEYKALAFDTLVSALQIEGGRKCKQLLELVHDAIPSGDYFLWTPRYISELNEMDKRIREFDEKCAKTSIS